MIKTNLQTLVRARDAFAKLSSVEMPSKTSYKLAKIIRQVNDELVLFDEQRLKLCKKYGAYITEENSYSIPPDKMPEFSSEYSKLLSVEVNLISEKVMLPETLSITPADILNLSDFIEIEGVEDDQ